MLKCEQFENRIQDLMDQRAELGSDPLLDEHARRCPDCRDILRSYLSLEDSFSGKLPSALLSSAEPSNPHPSAWLRLMPLAFTLALGMLIGGALGLMTGVFWAEPPEVASAPTVSSKGGGPSTHTGREPDSASSTEMTDLPDHSGRPVSAGTGHHLVDAVGSMRFPGVSLEQVRQQYPTLDLYYQISTELPGLRTIHQSFSLAWEWIARGLLGNDPPTIERDQ